MSINMISIAQKWKNLSILITAKAEHKEKFYNRIDCGDNGIVIRNYGLEGIPYLIANILQDKIRFDINLRGLILKKIKEYTDHRKTMTLVDYNDITEYNPENDCPICFETYSPILLKKNKGKATGDSCEHSLCWRCYITIVKDTNKCPICRVKLDSAINDTDDDDTDDDDTDDDDTDEDDTDDDDTDEDDTDDDDDDLFLF